MYVYLTLNDKGPTAFRSTQIATHYRSRETF